MNYRKYRLDKRNKIEVLVIDERSNCGHATILLDKDAYIKFLEEGGRKLTVQHLPNGSKRVVYKKGLGIKANRLDYYLQCLAAANRIARTMKRTNKKKG